jgi:hypothetical protein
MFYCNRLKVGTVRAWFCKLPIVPAVFALAAVKFQTSAAHFD